MIYSLRFLDEIDLTLAQIFGHGALVLHFESVVDDSLFIHGEFLLLLDYLLELGECGSV